MKFYVFFVVLCLLSLGFYGAAKNVAADSTQNIPENAYSQADLKNGAQLYDNWLNITKMPPEQNHPLYPVNSKKSGKTTWRCKECHGWDYIGNKGRYSKGSHFTGIPGVFHVQADEPETVFNNLTDTSKSHDFSPYLSSEQLWDLVKFLREGQKDIADVIDSQGNAKGNLVQGKILYDKECASCHGMDGDALDFKSDKEGEQGVGWLANDNPQESIHKIRWGHPGSDMPSMLNDKSHTEQEAIDILTYSQSLGRKQ